MLRIWEVRTVPCSVGKRFVLVLDRSSLTATLPRLCAFDMESSILRGVFVKSLHVLKIQRSRARCHVLLVRLSLILASTRSSAFPELLPSHSWVPVIMAASVPMARGPRLRGQTWGDKRQAAVFCRLLRNYAGSSANLRFPANIWASQMKL